MEIGERYIVKRGKAARWEVWSRSMSNCVGKEGTLISITLSGNGILAFDDGSYSCYVHPSWLEKVKRKPEFNELIDILDANGEWHNRHVAMILPDGKALCFLAAKEYPDEHRAYVWKEWRFIDQPSDDEWCKYNF